MADLAHMPFYVDDYESAAAHLTLEEDGAYNRLLRLCWRTPGCSIPDDISWITRKLRITGADFERVVAPLIEEFFTRQRGRVYQRRLMAEYRLALARVEKRKEAGKKGGIAKALKTNYFKDGNATDLLGENPSIDVATRTRTRTRTRVEEKDDVPSSKKKLTPRFALPDDVPDQQWASFIEMRRKIKKPMTDRAMQLVVNELRKLQADGHDPADVLDQSTLNGWQDVYPIKDKRPLNGNGYHREDYETAEQLASRTIASMRQPPPGLFDLDDQPLLPNHRNDQ